ncbi:hypothetical protein LCGC14_1532250 [marine sediment metagenome]|uniref:Uncharacterized protein n=1 Tax=marine sediment metagenome TaxID=412755 RepID=A0A0F9JGE0_9ZZZZ
MTENNHDINNNTVKIDFICSVCKTEKRLEFPKIYITQSKELTTTSISKGLVCKHQFQAIVDKNYQIRGYKINTDICPECGYRTENNTQRFYCEKCGTDILKLFQKNFHES